MKPKFIRKLKDEKGLLSLEASICLTFFIFVMLVLYSCFILFETRNVMAHAVLSTADSLSYDAYRTDKFKGGDDLTEIFADILDSALSQDNAFTSTNKWYTLDAYSTDWNGNIFVSAPIAKEGEETDDEYADIYGNNAFVSSDLEKVVKERFFAYLAGSDDTAEIEKILKRQHIMNGMSGVSFDGTKLVGKDLTIVITYTVEYEFNPFHLGEITFEQSCCSRIWK